MPPNESGNNDHIPVPGSVTPPPSLSPQKESPLQQIRTYQGDVASILQKENESVYTIQQAEVTRQAEKEKLEAGKRVAPVEPKKTKEHNSGVLLFLGTFVLLAIAGSLGWYAFGQYKAKTALPEVVVPATRFLAAETSVEKNTQSLDRDSLVEYVRGEREKSTKGIEHIILEKDVSGTISQTSAPLVTAEFLSFLRVSAPGTLIRAFDPLFMLGIFNDGTPHTFILVKLDSFENAYPGMLTWESTLKTDLLPLFASDETISTIPDGKKFQDVTIQNKDARVLKNASSTTVFLYSFFDNDTLIVTDTETSLRALIERLSAEKLAR